MNFSPDSPSTSPSTAAVPAGRRRDEILMRGEYSALPKSVLADRALSAGDKLVLMALIDHLGSTNVNCWPGPATLAAETGMTRRGVQLAVERLTAGGWISIVGVHPLRQTNVYVVNDVRQRTSCAGAHRALGVANNVRYPRRTSCATPSARCAPELLDPTTERNHRKEPLDTAAPVAGFAGDPPTGVALADPNGVGEPDGDHDGLSHDAVDQAPWVGIVEPKPLVPRVKSRQPVVSKAKPAGGLTEEAKAMILGTADAMEWYLLWGQQSPAGDLASLVPKGSNWRKYGGTSEEPKAELWDIPALAGYYWWRVSLYREKRQIPLTLPQWGRLVGDLKNLLATMTKKDLHTYIGVVVTHFDLIQFMCRSAGQTMALNESSLSHGLVKSTAANIAQMTGEGRAEKYRELRIAYGVENAA